MAERQNPFRKYQLPLLLVAALWMAFLVDWLLPYDAFGRLGLVPRDTSRLGGIVAMPLLHANWEHLISNTIPLLVLSFLLVAAGRGWGTVAALVALNGVLLWVGGRSGTVHGGASGLVYGLAGLLVARGVVEKRVVPLFVSAFVAVVYGGALLSGILPTQPGVSWDGHLAGAVAGIAVAASQKKKPDPQAQGTL